MSDEPGGPLPEPPRPKKAYSAPRLVEYGRAVDLTGGGTGSKQETGQPKATKFP
jgi:hypothetical protein